MPTIPRPPARRLRVYAFDPQASVTIDTADVNKATISLPWEEEWEEELKRGPSGEYLEVVDVDPASGLFYPPVDLNQPLLLAQDGLPPSEGNPQFHQQMVYTVAMKTIKAFERALGRKVLWSQARKPDNSYDKNPVMKLRIYPHALREPNAYYSPRKKAILFGYFRSSAVSGANLPKGWVFTCLSHDIIAHETAHAILDGLHGRFAESSNVDMRAFHEAFADIIALFQHFTMPEAVKHTLSVMRGRLRAPSLLSGLARQFGEATGRYGALREAIDRNEEVADEAERGEKKGDPEKAKPDPVRLDTTSSEPHSRGSVLVAAMFDAFVTIFERRTGDLMRMAGVPMDGDTNKELHPDLTARLTREAAKSAEHVMRMCIRALDYVPPVDVTFGEFLRAVITADTDLIPDDQLNYRLAVIEAFRRRGIYPENCLSLAPDSLMWETPDTKLNLRRLPGKLDLEARFNRRSIWEQAQSNQEIVNQWLNADDDSEKEWEDLLGVCFNPIAPGTVHRSKTFHNRPAVEVHSVRTTRRAGPDGQDLRQLIISIMQQRNGYFDSAKQEDLDSQPPDKKPWEEKADFVFRGGATLIADLRTNDPGQRNGNHAGPTTAAPKFRYVIRKSIQDDERLEAQRRFLLGRDQTNPSFTYARKRSDAEPFAFAHRG